MVRTSLYFLEPPRLMTLGWWPKGGFRICVGPSFFSVFHMGHVQQPIYAFGPVIHTLEGILFYLSKPSHSLSLETVMLQESFHGSSHLPCL